MSDEWVSTADAAQLMGVTAAAVRKRLRTEADALQRDGLVRRAPAGDDGGHDRWEISTALVSCWLPERTAERNAEDMHQEELEMTRRAATVLEIELERQKAETLRADNARLQADNARLQADNAQLRAKLTALADTLRLLAEP